MDEKQKAKLRLTHLGKKLSKKTKLKISSSKTGFFRGEQSPHWKGDAAGKVNMHRWVEKWKGKPKKCELCGTKDPTKTYDWANVDHSYKRVLEDYTRMCRSCHRKYDIKNNNYKAKVTHY